MKKWNKLLGMVIPSLCLMTMAPNMANADYNYDSSCDPCSFGGFEIGADFIYWKPCVDDLDYAAVHYERGNPDTSTGVSITTDKYAYKCICLGWEPGFRVRFGKNDILCNWNLSGSYLWLDINEKANCKRPTSTGTTGPEGSYIDSPLFHAALGSSDDPLNSDLTFARGDYSTTYQNWDAVLSYDIACHPCHTFQPFFGVEGLIYNQKLKVDAYVNSESEDIDSKHMVWTSDFFGVGMKMGTAYTFEFKCFKLYANASGAILVGDHDGVNKQTRWDASGNGFNLNFKDGDCCQFVPGYHMAAGMLYETDACGCEFAIRLGWEFVKWCNISNPRRFQADESELRTTASASDYTTVGFHGLVAGLDFSF